MNYNDQVLLAISYSMLGIGPHIKHYFNQLEEKKKVCLLKPATDFIVQITP